MNSTIAMLTSTAGLVVIVLGLGVFKGWIKLGSAVCGFVAGSVVGAAFSGSLRSLIQAGIGHGASLLQGAVTSVHVLGVQPGEWVPSWGWPIITVCLATILISSVVLMLDGARGGKKKAS